MNHAGPRMTVLMTARTAAEKSGMDKPASEMAVAMAAKLVD